MDIVEKWKKKYSDLNTELLNTKGMMTEREIYEVKSHLKSISFFIKDITALRQPLVSSRFDESTDVQERMVVEIYKDLLVELYDFAYEQAVKTGEVKKLHDIDRCINGC